MGQHLLHRLTDVAVRKAKPGRHTDGGGLYLVVRPNGGRSWILRVQRTDATGAAKRTDVGLGGYPRVSLEQARRKAAQLRDAVKERNADPVAVRDEPKKQEQAPTLPGRSTRQCAGSLKWLRARPTTRRRSWLVPHPGRAT